MSSLVFAHLALWLVIALLAVLTWVLARQVAALHRRVAPAGALAVNAVLAVGDRAPVLQVHTLTGKAVAVGTPGRNRLLLFIAPDCPISRSLTPVLASLPRAEPWLDVLLVSDGEEDGSQKEFAASTELAGLDYALSEPLGRAYGISKIPYAVLVDEAGCIAGLGIVNSREHLESPV